MSSRETQIKQFKHDIASPLAVLTVMLEMTDAFKGDDKKIVTSALKRMESIVSSLEKTEKCINSSAYELILQVLKEKEVESKHRDIKYHLEFSDFAIQSLCSIQPTEFKRVISNILNNSIDAIEQSGFIKVKGIIKNNKLLITITDNGRGICSSKMSQILEVGFSSKSSSGLGLSHAKHSISKWRGVLKVNSIFNLGTKITLIIPTLPKAQSNTQLAITL